MDLRDSLKKRLDFIYYKSYDENIINRLLAKIEECKSKLEPDNFVSDEKAIILISYADSINQPQKKPLETLNDFLIQNLSDTISIVHILPFFPSSSDDGFSVIDYEKVNPSFGEWEDIKRLRKQFSLAVDLVINHISQQNVWFRNYLKGISPGKDYFIELDPSADLSSVVRPRSHPLLTLFKTIRGEKYVWTTFSADQVDLNFKNPEVLEQIITIFLFYIKQGASIIRLDAIAFLWKQKNTNCLHLPQTHEVVKLLRDITDYLRNKTILLTETNVPSKENLSYFGNKDEAHMVYQFSLPPLLLYTLFSGNSEILSAWASDLPELLPGYTYFNFTASHDGIGVRPLEGLVDTSGLNRLITGMKLFGARISTKTNKDGSESPYEINISYFDALKGTHAGFDQFQEKRFLCSQTIMLTMQGIPAFYIHSLLATHNDLEGLESTGTNRSINRKKWDLKELNSILETPTEHSRVFNALKEIISIRKSIPDFHPNYSQKIFFLEKSFFIVLRNNGDLVSVSNITNSDREFNLSLLYKKEKILLSDKLSGNRYNSREIVIIESYQTLWLQKFQEVNQ
jgi:sucrose phosphorylase